MSEQVDELIANLRLHRTGEYGVVDGLMLEAADALESTLAELRQERERAESGSCWDDGPQMRTPGGCDPMPPKCELRAGHLGAHRSGRAEWMRNPASFNQVSKERDEARAALSRAEGTIEKVLSVPNEFEWDVPPTAKHILTEYKQKEV